MDPRGRTALVTGGAVRVGRAISLALADAGARVVVHHHASAKEAKRLVESIRADGREAATISADLRTMAGVRSLAKDAPGLLGPIDILVNNASTFPPADFAEVDEETWERTIAVNLRAPFFLSQQLGLQMKSRGV